MTLTFDWLRHYKKELQAHDTIPLTRLPSFPWVELASKLMNSFEAESIEFFPKEVKWYPKEELWTNLATPLVCLTFTVSPLQGEVYWIMSEEAVTILECLLLTNETNPLTIQDPTFKNSFYRFLAIETLYAISQTSFERGLVPLLTEKSALPNEDSLCLDMAFSINKRTLEGRLVISKALQSSLSNYFSRLSPFPSSLKVAKNITIPVHLEIGRAQLGWEEWKQAVVGDFIVLDQCFLQAEDLSGYVILSAFGKQTFKGALKDNQIQILEFPLFQEENTYMAKFEDDENEDKDDLSDLDFDDELEDFEELDEDLFSDLDEEEEEEKEESVFPEEEVEEEEEEEEKTSTTVNEEIQAAEDKSKQTQETVESAPGLVPPDQIPVSLIVELGCIQMTMDKLMQIEPGNLLDITVQPENGVDLTINGRLVAKGELIRIGENLGVRILEIG